MTGCREEIPEEIVPPEVPEGIIPPEEVPEEIVPRTASAEGQTMETELDGEGDGDGAGDGVKIGEGDDGLCRGLMVPTMTMPQWMALTVKSDPVDGDDS